MNLPEEVRAAIDLIKAGQRQEGVAALMQLAEADVASAQWILGDFLMREEVVPEAEAICWLERAAAHEHPQAIYELALFRAADAWPPAQGTSAANSLLRAGELGCADAQYDIGTFLATGEWQDPSGASRGRLWYQRAAEQGHAMAQASLAALLLDEGTPDDHSEGVRWLEAAAAQNEPEALARLEAAYREGLYGVIADVARAESVHQRVEEYLEKYSLQNEARRQRGAR